MKKFLRTLLLLMLFSQYGFSQDPIKGVVTDSQGEPIVGATIQEKGTKNYSVTDINGQFSLVSLQSLPITLQISAVGAKRQEVEIYEIFDETLEINLKLDNFLDEVIIVGYGEQRRQDVVGSVTKVDPVNIKAIPEASFETQLQGKAAGVQINAGTGVPGGNSFVRIRGATSINSGNEPLYIIDGVFVNSTSPQQISADRGVSPLADLNPNDIESIEILKDAAAVAIYGSRGANGVIIITTKRGNFEQKPSIQFNVSQGYAWAPPERMWKWVDGPDHARLVDEFRANEGLAPLFTGESVLGLPEDQITEDRASYLFRVARLQNYNINLTGGSQNTSYYLAFGHTDQEGIWRPMGFRRSSLKINVDQKVNERLTIGVSNTLSLSHRDIGRADGDGPSGALYQTIEIPPLRPLFDEKGNTIRWGNFDNVVDVTQKPNVWSDSYRYIGSLFAEYDLAKGLKLRSSFNVDYTLYNENEYWPLKTLRGAGNNGEASSSHTQLSSWINEQVLNYRTSFGNHNVALILGNQFQSNRFDNTFAYGTNFPNDNFRLISAATNQTVEESFGANRLISGFARIEYNFSQKYYLELVGRADGSSKFSRENRWGYFPAVGFGWNINQENFLKDVKLVSLLKLRANYGIAGNQNGISDFAYRGLWSAGFGYPSSGTIELPGISPEKLANQGIGWEKTAQYNVGIDAGFLSDRISFEFNYYDKKTTGVLLEVPVPAYTGFSNYLTNLGEITNKGFELAINSININNRIFHWASSFNIARNVNEVNKLPSPLTFEDRQFVRLENGYPLYSYWLYEDKGVDPQTGDVIYNDLNGDGQITSEDRRVIQNAWPSFFGGLSNSFTYKGFDLNILINFSYGNYVWNHNRALAEHGGRLGLNRALYASALDRWQQPGDITNEPRLAAKNYSIQQSSRFFEDGSFLRVRSVNLGYTLPSPLTNRISVDKVRIYVVATNLWLLTKYTGYDPETILERGGNSNNAGHDFASPPTPRTIQLGLNLTL